MKLTITVRWAGVRLGISRPRLFSQLGISWEPQSMNYFPFNKGHQIRYQIVLVLSFDTTFLKSLDDPPQLMGSRNHTNNNFKGYRHLFSQKSIY